jgi:DNA invertase Pin-like site-specific DNA recombinase
MASVAQWERRIIGQRTREGLAVKKAQGVKLGRPRSIDPAIASRIIRLRRQGLSFEKIGAEVGLGWTTVRRVVERHSA